MSFDQGRAAQPPARPAGGLGPLGQPLERPEVTRKLRPMRVLARASIVLIWLTTMAAFVSTASSWFTVLVVQNYLSDTPTVTDDTLTLADGISLAVAIPSTMVSVATLVVFLCWLQRARANAEVLSYIRHRRSRGWVIGAWFVPIIQLWWPKQIVDDIWRTSDPHLPPRTVSLDAAGPTSALVAAWWWTYVAAWLLDRVATRMFRDPTIDNLRTSAIIETAATLLTLVAAITVVMVIRRITTWQTRRPGGQPGFAMPVQPAS
jgi:hypothetical protein